MSNDADDLEKIRLICKQAIKDLAKALALADKLDDPRVAHRIHSAQSKVLFARFAVHQLMRDQYIDVCCDADELDGTSICDECPC